MAAGPGAPERTHAAAPPAHPPKIEVFDTDQMVNIDPKGFVRAVDEYRVHSCGLFMARPVVGHPTLAYFESWLLPTPGLRVSRQWCRPGAERDYDYYVDVVEVVRDGSRWRTVDHYLDLLVRTGREVEVVDIDELLAAVRSGLISVETAHGALHTAYRAVAGLAAHGYDLHRWLAAAGIELTWRRPARTEPAS